MLSISLVRRVWPAVILCAGLTPAPAAVELEILRPRELPASTTLPTISIVGRTDSGVVTTASVAGVDVPVFTNGVFVRDGVPLQLGANQVPVSVAMPDGTGRNERVLAIERTPEPPPAPPVAAGPTAIEAKSIEPKQNVSLEPGALLEVSFRGTPGRQADFHLEGLPWISMAEVADPASTAPSGLYRATITMPDLPADLATEATSQPLTLRLQGERQEEATSSSTVMVQSPGRVVLWRNGPVRMLRVKDTRGSLKYGLTEVRLGGPNLAEVPKGTLLRAVGRLGPHYRVRLTPALEAWIHASEVEPAPPGTQVPHLDFTSVMVSSSPEGDVLSIPYAAPVPYAVDVSADACRPAELVVDLYGAHKAGTWLSHRNHEGGIRRVSLEQAGTDHLRVKAELKSPVVWGYKTEATTSALRITVRRPPSISGGLAGLTVAVNAGHGGREGGATGITGAREADVTLAVAKALADELTSAGARPIMIRASDEVVSISRRAELAMEAKADLFVSVHCNSGGTQAGYLITSGTSTYYKHAFNHTLAADVLEEVRKATGLSNFGLIGNFNYGPIRLLTWMPAILVETAFISNPQEEAMLTNPQFQQTMARAIRVGLERYLADPGKDCKEEGP